MGAFPKILNHPNAQFKQLSKESVVPECVEIICIYTIYYDSTSTLWRSYIESLTKTKTNIKTNKKQSYNNIYNII